MVMFGITQVLCRLDDDDDADDETARLECYNLAKTMIFCMLI